MLQTCNEVPQVLFRLSRWENLEVASVSVVYELVPVMGPADK